MSTTFQTCRITQNYIIERNMWEFKSQLHTYQIILGLLGVLPSSVTSAALQLIGLPGVSKGKCQVVLRNDLAVDNHRILAENEEMLSKICIIGFYYMLFTLFYRFVEIQDPCENLFFNAILVNLACYVIFILTIDSGGPWKHGCALNDRGMLRRAPNVSFKRRKEGNQKGSREGEREEWKQETTPLCYGAFSIFELVI